MFNAAKTVPDTSGDMTVAAAQLSAEPSDIHGYMSMQVITGSDVYMMWRLGAAAVPTAADVVAAGFVVGSTGSPISVQDPANPADPSRLYLATVTGAATFRAFA